MAAVWLLGAACVKSPLAPVLPKPVSNQLIDASYRAGFARGAILAPAGLSAGGYGLRPGPVGRFNARLGAMRGAYGTLWIKAFALENGGGAVLWVKLPMVFPSDLLRRKTLQKMAAMSGMDFADALILTATHTHSGPARFWALPRGILSVLGVDDYDPDVLDAIADDVAHTALSAWNQRQSARVGIREILRFDPDNQISADRRSENDNLYTDLDDPNVYRDEKGTYKSKDNHMLLIRVEDMQGKPIGGIIRFGVHGTVLAHEMFSEDVPGAIEAASEKQWNVPLVMFLQGTAGDVTPGGGDRDREALQRIEAVGVRAARVAWPVFDMISTMDHGIVATAHRWRRVDRTALGYTDREFGRAGSDGTFYPFTDGAIMCGDFGAEPPPDSGKPQTVLRDGHLGCMGIDDLSSLLTQKGSHESPPQELSRAVLSAVRIGDWRFVTFPGEPVSQLGTLMLAKAAKAGFKRNVAVMGYSQTHLFYLTSKQDWFQGGYEAGMNIWGWRLGEWLADQNVALLTRLDRFGTEPAWDGDEMEPLPREDEALTAFVSAAHNPKWLGMDRGTVDRLGQIGMSWKGGDPWLDRPVLEVVDAAGKSVSRSGDPGWAIYNDEKRDSGYRATWEPGADVRSGSYQVLVDGRTAKGQRYHLESDTFVVSDGALLQVTGTAGAGQALLYAAYRPHPETFEWLFADQLPRFQTGGFRLINDQYGPSDAIPVTSATLTGQATWLYAATRTPVSLALAWSLDCQCYSLDFPAGATALSIASRALLVAGESNESALLLEP